MHINAVALRLKQRWVHDNHTNQSFQTNQTKDISKTEPKSGNQTENPFYLLNLETNLILTDNQNCRIIKPKCRFTCVKNRSIHVKILTQTI